MKARSFPTRCSAASSTTTAASPRNEVLGSLHDPVPLPRAWRGLLNSSWQTLPTTGALRPTSQPYQSAGQPRSLPNPFPDEFWDTMRMSSALETALRALWGTDEFLDRTGTRVQRRRVADVVVVEQFQSSSDPKVGCNYPPARGHPLRACFNPHPTRRSGATPELLFQWLRVRVSILTRPEGRV